MQNHKPYQALCPAVQHFTVCHLCSPIAASRKRQGWVQALCNFSFFPHVFCHVFWIWSYGWFLGNSAHSNTLVRGGLRLYCRLYSMRAFSGTQVLSLHSVQDSFHFPFPSRGEAEAAHHLPGDADGFRGIAARGTAVHEQCFVGAGVTLFIGSSKTLICPVATSVMLQSSCSCVFTQPWLFTELAF